MENWVTDGVTVIQHYIFMMGDTSFELWAEYEAHTVVHSSM